MSRRFNIIATVVISAIFLGLTAVFWQSYVRFGEACKDFGLSVAYYVCELFGIDYSFTPTVTEYCAWPSVRASIRLMTSSLTAGRLSAVMRVSRSYM